MLNSDMFIQRGQNDHMTNPTMKHKNKTRQIEAYSSNG